VRPPPLPDLELLLRARERAPELERGRVVERERDVELRDRDLALPTARDALELERLPDLLEPPERLLVFPPVERLLVLRPACCSAMEPSSSGHVPLWLPNFETSKPSAFERYRSDRLDRGFSLAGRRPEGEINEHWQPRC
jgi:hypothetical protein